MQKRLCLFVVVLCVCVLSLAFSGCIFGDNKETKKAELTADMVDIPQSRYYTGEAIELSPSSIDITYDGRYLASTSFLYEYQNNIEVGTATIIITARDDNKYVTGSVTLHFEILPGYGQIDVATLDEAVAELNGYHYARVRLTNGATISQDQTLNIPENKTLVLAMPSHEFVNFGTINIAQGGRLSIGSSVDLSTLINVGTITCAGELDVYAYGALYNSGTLTVSQPIQLYGRLYTNTDLQVDQAGTSCVYKKRTMLNSQIDGQDVVKLANAVDGKVRYSQDENIQGKASIKINDSNASYMVYINLQYTHTDTIGNASVTIVADPRNKDYGGSTTINYQVVPGIIDCANNDALVAAHNSILFNEYNLAKDMTISSDYVFANDEVLVLNGATISGDVVLNGAIQTIEPSVLAGISISGSLENNGTIAAQEKVGISVAGTLVNNGTLQAQSLVINTDGTLTNNASMTTTSISNLGTLINSTNATISSDDLYNISIEGTTTNAGTINNVGILTLWQNSVLNNNSGASLTVATRTRLFNATLNNQANATITLNGETQIKNINITNAGSIVNKSIINIEDSYTNFANTGSWDNSLGYVWAFDTIKDKGINENITYRERLSDIDVALTQDTFEYDQTTHKPTFTVKGETLDASEYTIRYAYSQGTADTLFKNIGTINVTITIKDYQNIYGGSTTLSYTITPGTVHIENYYNFSSVLGNANWGTIILDTDVSYTTEYHTIGLLDYQTLDTNGHKLSLNARSSTFNNRGTLILGHIGDELSLDNCALQIKGVVSGNYNYSYTFNNYGTIVNNSILYVNEQHGYFVNQEGGTITNNGKIFSWYGSQIDANGNVFNRAAISGTSPTNNSGAVTLSSYSVDYTGAELCPSVTIKRSSTTLNNDDFNIIYSNNTNAGTAEVRVSPNTSFNHYYVGSSISTFVINRVVYTINENSIDSTNCTTFFDNTNYYKYVLTKNLNVYHSFTIPDGLIVDTKGYRFIQQNSGYRITLGEGVQLWMETNNIADFTTNNLQYLATKITLSGDVGTYGTEATIKHELKSEAVDNNTFFVGEDPYNLTIDLNGHNLYARIYLFQDCNKQVNVSIINSSNTDASVGYAENTYSIWQTGANGKDDHITLDNLQLNSLHISGPNIQTINVSNCVINNTYSNTGTGGIGLYVYSTRNYQSSGEIRCLTTATFTNCSFTGYTAANIQGAGYYTFTGCTFSANGNYLTNGTDNYRRKGTALTIQHAAEHISVDITGGSMSKTATNGYLVEVVYIQTGTTTVVTETTASSYNASSGYHYAN